MRILLGAEQAAEIKGSCFDAGNNRSLQYTYDALNRLIGKSYTATTPATPSVTYFYDQTSYNGLNILNGKGRMGMSDGSGRPHGAWKSQPTMIIRRLLLPP